MRRPELNINIKARNDDCVTDLGSDEDLDGASLEEALDDTAILLTQGLVIVANSVLERLLKARVREVIKVRL
jgi:hypothetical protein